jgi:PAS domain S-box-containing protein
MLSGTLVDASRRYSNRPVYLAGVLFTAITILAAAIAIWELHADRIADEMQDTHNLAVVLSEQTTRTFQAVDLVLREVQSRIESEKIETSEQFRQLVSTEKEHRFLRDRLRSLPQADAISLIDDTGKIVNFSRAWPVPVLDTSDRDFYDYWRNHDDPGVLIGMPVINRVTGEWVLTITRRISGVHGEFLGIALGVLRVGYFEDFYQAIHIGDGVAVGLFRADGTLLGRYPDLETAIGTKLPDTSPWYRAVADGGGTFRARGYIGGVPRIISVQQVREYPLVVTVGIDEDVALAPWRHQSMMIAIGGFGGIVGFVVLTSALAMQFRRLGQSEERFRGFALTSSDWFWETDQQHRISYMSEGVSTTGFGIRPRDLLGRTRIQIAADAGAEMDKWEEHFAALERHEPFRNFTYTWKNPGGLGTAEISGDPIFDEKGRFRGYRGTGRDISPQVRNEQNLREAKDEAEAANVAKSRLLANTSHELRTPLNAILGFSEVLQLGMAGPLLPRQAEYIGDIQQSGEHLLSIINDILDLAKVDAGKLDLAQQQDVEPSRIVEDSLTLVRGQAAAAEVQLSATIAEDIPTLTADPIRLKQVIVNLLSNAIKFTEPGGSVTVTTRGGDAGQVVFEVRDTGIGMSAAEIAVALQPFGQVDADDTRRYQGTGLGLPLSVRLVELHGGRLTLESTKGQGTRVVVSMPAHQTSSLVDRVTAATA